MKWCTKKNQFNHIEFETLWKYYCKYPGIDILKAMKAAQEWLEFRDKKGYKSYDLFMNNWLKRNFSNKPDKSLSVKDVF